MHSANDVTAWVKKLSREARGEEGEWLYDADGTMGTSAEARLEELNPS